MIKKTLATSPAGNTRKLAFLFLCVFLFANSGCSKVTELYSNWFKPNTNNVDINYAALNQHIINSAQHSILRLQTAQSEYELALDTFLSTSNESNLLSIQSKWTNWNNAYINSKAFLVFAVINKPALQKIHQRIDQPLMLPGYIDYIDMYPTSGIVNDDVVALSEKSIIEQHGYTSNDDVSLGFYALEFLLWGEDGLRPSQDYTITNHLDANEKDVSTAEKPAPNPSRRRQYLKSISKILSDDINNMSKLWIGADSLAASKLLSESSAKHSALIILKSIINNNNKSQSVIKSAIQEKNGHIKAPSKSGSYDIIRNLNSLTFTILTEESTNKPNAQNLLAIINPKLPDQAEKLEESLISIQAQLTLLPEHSALGQAKKNEPLLKENLIRLSEEISTFNHLLEETLSKLGS